MKKTAAMKFWNKNEMSKIMKNLCQQPVEIDQDWEHETTTLTFFDGSKIVSSESDYYVTEKIVTLEIIEKLYDEVEKFRIDTEGKVHVLGRMPNTNQHGWFFGGYVKEIGE